MGLSAIGKIDCGLCVDLSMRYEEEEGFLL